MQTTRAVGFAMPLLNLSGFIWNSQSIVACHVAEGLGDEILEDGRTARAVLFEESLDEADMPEEIPALRMLDVIVSLVA